MRGLRLQVVLPVVLAVILGAVAWPLIGTTQTKPEVAQQMFTEEELEKIRRRLDQIAENHQKLLQAIQDIKTELAIVKIRVTR